ncbi:MoaD/ThiS family protein [Trichloromonas sp.]|uniref:MoaD/ThiS family protein n=1 Tax=Trichloromonas sp. TaxID=3069249 RepID=UPI003D813818
MQVTVKLYGSFRVHRFKEGLGHYPEGATVQAVVVALGIPLEQADIVIINEQRASIEHVLHDGDVVAIFPLVAGG